MLGSLATASLFLCLPTLPQEPGGDARLRREADFARALTIELGFDALAEEVLTLALKGANGQGRSELLLARCDVRKTTAQRAAESERLAALESAAAAYADFLNASPPAQLATNARVALGELAFQYGAALQVEIADLPMGSAKREALITAANTLFMDAKSGLDRIIELWETMADGDEKDSLRFSAYFPAKYFKAQLFYFWAAAFAPDTLERLERADKALELFEDFALLAGDSSRPGFMAYKQMADTFILRAEAEIARDNIKDAKSTFEEAEAFYLHIIENAIPESSQLAEAEIDDRRQVQQDAYLGLMNLHPKWGAVTNPATHAAAAAALGESFRQWVDDESVLLAPSGYRMLLMVANNQIRIGNYTEAISLAELVARENETSRLRLEANEVMGDAIAAAPEDAKIDLGVVYAAAEGAFFQKEFAKSRDGFLLLLTRLSRSRQADEYGSKTYYYLGRSYSYLEQPLESAVSHQLGYTLFPDHEDFANKNAQAWMKLADRFRSSNPGDVALDRFFKDAINAVTSSGNGSAPDQAQWNAAQSDYQLAKDKGRAARGKEAGSPEARAAIKILDAAIASYKKIERGSRYFEQAMVQIGMCQFRRATWRPSAANEAFRIFDDYLEVFIKNPDNTPQDARGRKTRADASAQADFYRGQTRYKQAKSGEHNHWTGVLKAYAGFIHRHPDQRAYAGASLVSMLEAHIALDDEPMATAAYDEIVASNYPDARIAQAAHYMFGFWNAKVKQQKGEERISSLTKAADYLGVANLRTSKKIWQNMLKEGRLRLEINQPAVASDILEKVLRDFSNDKSFSASNQFFAQLDLVDAYLVQFNTAQAGPIINQLLKDRPKNLRVITAASKVLAGWPVVRDEKVIEVDGVNTADAFTRANLLITTLTRLAEKEANDNEVNKFDHPPYWEARLQFAYLLYKRSQTDTTFKGKHRRLIESIERLAPDLGEAVAGPEMAFTLKWLKRRP